MTMPADPFACSTTSATSAMFTWSNPPSSSRRLTGQPPPRLAAIFRTDSSLLEHGAQPVDSGSRRIAGRFRIGLLMHEPAGEILTTDPVAVAQHELNCGLLDI